MITIKVNQENHKFLNNITIKELVEFLKVQTNGIAIAVNNSVIKRSDWSDRLLDNNDDILIIKSTQGG